jgi:hypothetical protein
MDSGRSIDIGPDEIRGDPGVLFGKVNRTMQAKEYVSMMTTKLYVSAVVGVYPDIGQAQSALQELKEAEFPTDDLSLVGSQEDVRQAQQGYFHPPHEVLRGALREGAALGGEIGAATGLITGLFTFLIPGLGVLAALGPLAGLLMGAGIGAVTGGPLGAVNYQDDAIEYRGLLEKGNVFVIVHCTTTAVEQQAHAVLTKTHPRELHIAPYVG